MARFTQAGGDGSGIPGPQGPAGEDGADALWNFIGEYDNGADYYPGDLVTYNGGTYYRVGEPNPGYPPGTSYWTTIAEPGSDADIADFVFDYVSDGSELSTMTINNHDMLIRTTHDADQDADITIEAADDVWINAGHEFRVIAVIDAAIKSHDYVQIVTDEDGAQHSWTFDSSAGLTFPDNTVQTTAYIPGTGVNGEVTRWTPNFTATGLAFTGTGATHPTYNSHYVKNGRMVSFWIAIDLATVTNFGTGQYKTELPFAPLTGTMNHFQAWANVDPLVNPDIAGHVVLQADHLANTSVLDLHYLKQAGGANSPLMEAMLVQDEPATFTTSSKIYINGTYITAE